VDGAGDVPTVAPADAVEEPIGVGRGGEADAMGDGGREFETPSTGPQPVIRIAEARHASARDRDPTPDSRCRRREPDQAACVTGPVGPDLDVLEDRPNRR
jgi:hypothetical protein